MSGEILTVGDVCEYLKIPRSTLYKLSKDKIIPAFRVGRHWRFQKEKIEAWLEGQTSEKVSRQ
ncbi:MAG: helix-turn-helix domain-containing protein [Candidatus Omnitrophica bacterium]|nr:helix-turn-helix domain-containing protein [Candidatus Omnitrophota bacterium]